MNHRVAKRSLAHASHNEPCFWGRVLMPGWSAQLQVHQKWLCAHLVLLDDVVELCDQALQSLKGWLLFKPLRAMYNTLS